MYTLAKTTNGSYDNGFEGVRGILEYGNNNEFFAHGRAILKDTDLWLNPAGAFCCVGRSSTI